MDSVYILVIRCSTLYLVGDFHLHICTCKTDHSKLSQMWMSIHILVSRNMVEWHVLVE